MARYANTIIVLCVGQAFCLACGLWVSDQFLLQASTEAPTVGEQAGGVGMGMIIVRIMSLAWIIGLQSGLAYLLLARLRNEHTNDDTQFRMRIAQRETDLVRTRNAVIFGLAKLADYRDRETGQHLERIALYSTRLAAAMRADKRYRGTITSAFVKLIGISSVLHDVGKVAVHDSVLRKAGPLTDEERAKMQKHTDVGAECIRQIEQRLGSGNFLNMARQIAHGHHERWDGNGYPCGVAGEQIPLAARIVAVADVYDALASKRVYKEAYSHDKCVEIIRQSAGTQFDPSIVEVFLNIAPEFQQIASRFGNNEPAESPTWMAASPSADQLMKSLLEQDNPAEQLVTAS